MLTTLRSSINMSLRRFISFKDLGVQSEIVKKLNGLSIVTPTSIQEKSIPLQLKNEYPIVLSSETGSGKTLAYLLPYLNDYITNANTRMIVVTPRKELAYQIDTVLHRLAPSIQSAVLVGKSGATNGQSSNGIERGVFPNVIIGTAIPVHEYIRKSYRKCDTETMSMYQRLISKLVLDEADVLLNDPFKGKVLDSLRTLRRINRDLSVVAAGATLPRNGRCSAGGVLESEFRHLTWVEGCFQNRIPDNISVEFIEQSDEETKLKTLEQLTPQLKQAASLVFVRNAKQCEFVAERLRRLGVNVQTLSQDDSQEKREEEVQRVLEGKDICTVCTDILSRGLDTRTVTRIVQYDFACDVSTFLHRCGRTGRNGEKGWVTCLVSPENELLYRRIMECGVHNDLSSLYSRKRMLRKKERKQRDVV